MVDWYIRDGANRSVCFGTDGLSGLLDWGRLDGPDCNDRLVCSCE
ncbi:MAG: hypothetical protein RJB05_631 [Armatimonadota bacterium]